MKNLNLIVVLLTMIFFGQVKTLAQPIPFDADSRFAPRRFSSVIFQTGISASNFDPMGKVMEVRSDWWDSGQTVQLYDRYLQNGFVPGTVQEWLFLPAGRIGGTMSFFIVNKEYEKYLDGRMIGGAVTVRTGDNSQFQRWFQLILNGKVTYMNAATNLVLSRTGSGNGSVFTMKTISFAATQQLSHGVPNFLITPNFPIAETQLNQNARAIESVAVPAYQVHSFFDFAYVLGHSYDIEDTYRKFHAQFPVSFSPYSFLVNSPMNLPLGSIGAMVPGTVVGATFPVNSITEGRQLWYMVNSKYVGESYLINAEFGLALTANDPLYPGSGMTVELLGTQGARQRWTFPFVGN